MPQTTQSLYKGKVSPNQKTGIKNIINHSGGLPDLYTIQIGQIHIAGNPKYVSATMPRPQPVQPPAVLSR